MPQSATNKETQTHPAAAARAVFDTAGRLIDSARPLAVFAEPVTSGDTTVIGAAEVVAGGVFGGGGGSSPATGGDGQPTPEATDNVGMGSGAGGFATSRPVAVIIIDANGARVEPVVDVTKLGLAALTAFGSVFFMFSRMLRRGR